MPKRSTSTASKVCCAARCADAGSKGHLTNSVAGYRCRHGHTNAKDPSVPRPRNTYLREDRVLAKLPLLRHMLTAAEPAAVVTGAPASAARAQCASPSAFAVGLQRPSSAIPAVRCVVSFGLPRSV